jgi:hypothetical protein
MTGIIIGALVLVAAIVAFVFLTVRRKSDPHTSTRSLRKLADVRGWHFSNPDTASSAFGLSGESMLQGADESALDWRVRWHLRTKRKEDREVTEFKCADVPLEQGWVFLEPRASAAELKARQRTAESGQRLPDDLQPGVKKSAWKEAQLHAREMQVGTPDFLAQFYVASTGKESMVRRLIPQRMQKALLALPGAGHISVRMGAEGVVIVSPAIYATDRVEQLIKVGEILISSVAQEQTAQVVA